MPLYRSICLVCDTVTEQYRPVARYNVMPVCCGKVTKSIISAPYVMPDIQPYKTVAADKETGKTLHISGRKAHKDFLRRNGYEELGNDPIKQRTDDGSIDKTTDSVIDEIRHKWRG